MLYIHEGQCQLKHLYSRGVKIHKNVIMISSDSSYLFLIKIKYEFYYYGKFAIIMVLIW